MMSDQIESTDIVEIEEPHVPSRVIGGMPYFEQYLMLADRISRTAMVPSNLRGKPDEVLAVVMYGAELGIGPMQALQQINFIAGKPSASAELLRALVLEAGHQFIVQGDTKYATAKCKRKDWDEWQETSFTIDDAAAAGLLNKRDSGWDKYPDQMLSARVTSKAARMWFADVISGMSYTPEEVRAFSGQTEADEMASEEDLEKVRTALSMLEEADKETLTQQWKDAAIPPFSAGLTRSQCLKVIDLITALLDEPAHEEDDGIQDAEIIGTEAAEVLERKPFEFAPESERFA